MAFEKTKTQKVKIEILIQDRWKILDRGDSYELLVPQRFNSIVGKKPLRIEVHDGR